MNNTRPSMSTARKVGLATAALVGAAAIVFILQNSEEVDVEFLGWTIRAPLFLIMILSGATVVGLRDLIAWALRRRRSVAERRQKAPAPEDREKGNDQ